MGMGKKETIDLVQLHLLLHTVCPPRIDLHPWRQLTPMSDLDILRSPQGAEFLDRLQVDLFKQDRKEVSISHPLPPLLLFFFGVALVLLLMQHATFFHCCCPTFRLSWQ